MPELPEVETTKNAILPFQGKTLKRIIVNNPSLRWPIDEKAINKIKEKKILSITRRAKYIFLHHTAGWHNPYNQIDQWDKDSRGCISTEFVIGGQSILGNDNNYYVPIKSFVSNKFEFNTNNNIEVGYSPTDPINEKIIEYLNTL